MPPASALAGLTYLSLVSMFLGFVAWYAGLARGGVARISQVQLAQPLLTVSLSVLVLGEHVTPFLLAAACAVLVCTAATQRARIAAPAPVVSQAAGSATARAGATAR